MCDLDPACLSFRFFVDLNGTEGDHEAGDCLPWSSSNISESETTNLNLDLYVKGDSIHVYRYIHYPQSDVEDGDISLL